jgi:AbrB family looped-hinge helix DNA binding protein
MSETMIDERGRVLIPEEIRKSAGLTGGTVVAVEAKDGRVVIKTVRRERRDWENLCVVPPEDRQTGMAFAKKNQKNFGMD